MKTAKRLEHIQEYYFSRKLKEINSLISAGKPIINLGIGSPDIMPPRSVVEKLKKSLDSPVAHKYQGYKGIEPFRIAIKDFYQNNYKVKLDSNNQILPLKDYMKINFNTMHSELCTSLWPRFPARYRWAKNIYKIRME